MAALTGSAAGLGTGRGKRASTLRKHDAAAARSGNDASLLRRSRCAGVARGEALSELKKLFEVLSNTKQTDQMAKVALNDQIQALTADELVRHPERDVRLWTAKCLAEALCIYAPKPPFDDAAQLRAINVLFVEQIGTLLDPALSDLGLALVERLASICGFMLIFDCSDQEELLIDLVDACISVARSGNNERLEGPLLQVLSNTLAEADEVPKSVWVNLVELLTARGRASRGASLARRVLASLASRSAMIPINEFLNASLYPSPEEVSQPMQTSDARTQRDALLAATAELYAVDPALVARVMPNLQADLQCADADRRQAVTKCVGQVLGQQPSSNPLKPLMLTNPLLFEKFLERLVDANEGVRLAALDGVGAMLATAVIVVDEKGAKHMNTIVKSIAKALKIRCLDPCEEVRIRVVDIAAKTTQSLTGFKMLTQPDSSAVLPEIFGRILDKKPSVRDVCIEALSCLYSQHALPAWVEGRQKEAEEFAFIPRLLCEAYAVFALGRRGHTVRLETCIEEHILGCGLSASQRGLALAGLLASVAGYEASEKGLHQLLERKRDGNAALRMFLKVRTRGAPVLGPDSATGSVAPCLLAAAGALGSPALTSPGEEAIAGSGPPQMSAQDAERTVTNAVEALARVNPVLEDHHYSREVHLKDLKRLDLVRDRALWKALIQLTMPVSTLTTATMHPQMVELDELLRRKGLEDLRPLLRRCLLSTWLLPDQVSGLLDVWGEGSSDAESSGMCMVVQRAVAQLPKYFPGAFVPHVARISQHLQDPSTDSVNAGLQALARIGKRYAMIASTRPAGDLPAILPPAELAEHILGAVERLCGAESSGGDAASTCRKALRSFGVLPHEHALPSVEKVLDWATEKSTMGSGKSRSIALRLVSACIDSASDRPGCPEGLGAKAISQEWVFRARGVLHEAFDPSSDPSLRVAAVELLAATGQVAEMNLLFDSPKEDSLRLHAAVSTLRAVRRGTLALSTGILQRIAVEACAAISPDHSGDVGELLDALQKIVKPTGFFQDAAQLKLSDRLRLCSTLPTVFAQSQMKRHKEAALRILQSAIVKAVRQSGAQQKPLLDFAVACFIHFLARLPAFVQEASAKYSAFTESSQISSLFVEALVHVEPPKSTELSSIVLRVTERVHLFVDREDPTSDMVHKAAQVLKYTMEKRCPELGKIDKTLQGVCRGSMPAELFAIGTPSGHDCTMQPSQLESGRSAPPNSLAPTALHDEPLAGRSEMKGQSTRISPVEVLHPRLGTATAAASSAKSLPVRPSPIPSLLSLSLGQPNSEADTGNSLLSEVAPGQASPVMPADVADARPSPMVTMATSPQATAMEGLASEAAVSTPIGDASLAPRRLEFPTGSVARGSAQGLTPAPHDLQSPASHVLESSLIRPRRRSAGSGVEAVLSPEGAQLLAPETKRQRIEPPSQSEPGTFE